MNDTHAGIVQISRQPLPSFQERLLQHVRGIDSPRQAGIEAQINDSLETLGMERESIGWSLLAGVSQQRNSGILMIHRGKACFGNGLGVYRLE